MIAGFPGGNGWSGTPEGGSKNTIGATLIEALLAIAILGIAIVPVSSMIMGSVQQIDTSQDTTLLQLCVQARMEEARAVDFDSLASATDFCDETCDCQAIASANKSIPRSLTVTANPGAAFDNNMKLVEVSMEHVTMETLRVKRVK